MFSILALCWQKDVDARGSIALAIALQSRTLEPGPIAWRNDQGPQPCRRTCLWAIMLSHNKWLLVVHNGSHFCWCWRIIFCCLWQNVREHLFFLSLFLLWKPYSLPSFKSLFFPPFLIENGKGKAALYHFAFVLL